MNLISSANVLSSGLIAIPVIYFLWYNWKLRKENGLIKLVRTITIWWVLAFLTHYLVAFYLNFLAASGKTVVTDFNTWLLFLSNCFILVMTLYSTITFYLISKHPPKKH